MNQSLDLCARFTTSPLYAKLDLIGIEEILIIPVAAAAGREMVYLDAHARIRVEQAALAKEERARIAELTVRKKFTRDSPVVSLSWSDAV